jgi:hypothetical protein
MRITKQGTTVLDTNELQNHIKLKDLRAGDVFRFAAGHEKNIYLKKASSYVQLSTGNEFDDYQGSRKTDALVIVYPHAVLELGAELSHHVEVLTVPASTNQKI